MKRHAVSIAAVLSVAMTAILWRQQLLLAVILAILACCVFLVEGLNYTKMFAVTGLLGTVTEAICIHYGAWHYTKSGFWGVPYWLPILWGMAGVTSLMIGERLGYVRKSSR